MRIISGITDNGQIKSITISQWMVTSGDDIWFGSPMVNSRGDV